MWYPSDAMSVAATFHFLENCPVMHFSGEKNASTHGGNSPLTLEKGDGFLTFIREEKI